MNLRAFIFPVAVALVYGVAMIAIAGVSAPAQLIANDGGEGETLKIPAEFFDLAERDYPLEFAVHFGQANRESFLSAIDLGQQVYAREGCFHCHTQRVRNHESDIARWGKPNRMEEYAAAWHSTPMLGARRIGPDLGRESNRRSNDWHAAHLYAPDAVVPRSIMPAFPWLLEKSHGRMMPNKEGLALIVYLQSLGSPAEQDHR